MLEYSLRAKIREEIKKDEPAVKAALCKIANRNFGDQGKIRGIHKNEGGIAVNGCEIAIKGNYVIDDWKSPVDPTEEERAAVDAIAEVASIIETEGVESLREKYGECNRGDPLRLLMAGP